MAQTILLVDDNTELLTALTKVLEKEGYRVTALPTADRAVEYMNTTNQRPDLIITDVSMPGMKGIEFLSIVKNVFPNIPVILITAFGEWDQYMDALRRGAFAYLSKPIEKNELLTTVRRALASG
ncbi:MAG: response regulator [Verrucomicrobiae bacterium]|nr:response regulator [Verrucomicrobiae bacterium]MDW8343814.1 response regulator [Verrucomicrobiae bacterium]